MNSSDLYDLFRSEVADQEEPFLWSDTDVFAYMNDAYRMFVRLTGGISDKTSSLAQIAVVPDELFANMSTHVLRVMSAHRLSDGMPLTIHNGPEYPRLSTAYGAINGVVIGEEEDRVRWTSMPRVSDTVQLHVYRMPAGFITDFGQSFAGVRDDHHIHFLKWMKYLAYGKHDAETFDRKRSSDSEAEFRGYCAFVKLENERSKHKNRTVAYGGIPMSE